MRPPSTNSRAAATITQYNIGAARVTVNFGGACTLFSTRNRPGDGCALVSVDWSSTQKKDGAKFRITGTDQVSAAFVENRWWLCESDFLASGTNSATGAKMLTPFWK